MNFSIQIELGGEDEVQETPSEEDNSDIDDLTNSSSSDISDSDSESQASEVECIDDDIGVAPLQDDESAILDEESEEKCMLTIYLLYKTHINHKHKLLVETAVIIESIYIYKIGMKGMCEIFMNFNVFISFFTHQRLGTVSVGTMSRR